MSGKICCFSLLFFKQYITLQNISLKFILKIATFARLKSTSRLQVVAIIFDYHKCQPNLKCDFHFIEIAPTQLNHILCGKLKYFIPNNVITKINQAINVNIALNIIFAVNTDCMLSPDTSDKERNSKPTPNNLNTILYPFSIGKLSAFNISPFFIFFICESIIIKNKLY